MSTLISSLKLVAAKKPNQYPPLIQRRNNLIAKLFEQAEFATAVLNGTSYAPTRTRTIKDKETGLRQVVSRPKQVRQWWWSSESGKVCCSIKYGNKFIEIAKGKNAVEVSNLKELIETFGVIKSAVEAGELDAQIEASSGAVGNKAKK